MDLSEIDDDILQFIEENQQAESYSLSLKLKSFTTEVRRFIAEQIQARSKAKRKVPSFVKKKGLIMPPPESVEQASSEITARYKADLVQGSALIDMTGGLGVDTFYFAQKVDRVIYIEKNNQLAERAQHNFRKLGLNNIEVVHDDSVNFVEHYGDRVDTIYVDPSRRNQGRRFFKLEDSEPDIIEITSLLLQKSDELLVKISPFLDVSYLTRQFRNLFEIHVLAVDQECKEILLRMSKKVTSAHPKIITWAHDGKREQRFISSQEDNESPCNYTDPATYLYDPNASIRKAGLYNALGKKFGICQLSANSHLFTGTSFIDDFPGRAFRIEQNYSARDFYKKKPLNTGIIITRNFPENANHIRSKAGIREGSDVYVFATRKKDNQLIFLITSRMY